MFTDPLPFFITYLFAEYYVTRYAKPKDLYFLFANVKGVCWKPL